jgi:hypothetical protein
MEPEPMEEGGAAEILPSTAHCGEPEYQRLRQGLAVAEVTVAWHFRLFRGWGWGFDLTEDPHGQVRTLKELRGAR